MSEPSQASVRMRGLVTCAIVLGTCAYALSRTGLFSVDDARVLPSEVSLVGTWKYKLADSVAYADSKFDDSDWCLISVPDAGVAPNQAAADRPALDCPHSIYPREEMRGKTYWYRKTFNIPENLSWKDPSLFLGAVKDKAWVYWDGSLLGSVRIEVLPHVLQVNSTWTTPGRHVLAIRATTGQSLNPGLFHALKKQVVLGEFADQVSQIERLNRDLEQESAIAVIQFITLLVLTFFVARSGGSDENYFWLSIYFGAASIYSCSQLIRGNFQRVGESMAFIGMSVALAGYGTQLFARGRRHQYFGNRIVLGIGILSFAVEASGKLPQSFDAITVLMSLVYVIVFPLLNWAVAGKEKRSVQAPDYKWTDFATITTLVILHSAYFYDRIATGSNASYIFLPLITATLTIAVAMFTADEYINKVKMLAFFGRFIRPGLKSLIRDLRGSLGAYAGNWHRGARVALFKIDIVGYTDATYGMPYGIKRIFNDLWFTHIDQVLERISFFDHPEGDGSVYCIREEAKGGACASVVAAAQQVESVAIPAFDREFRLKVKKLVKSCPELKMPFCNFEKKYRDLSECDFWERQTRVRFVFHFGWVDEGLWGLKTKSHYNVQGNRMIEISRLEKFAREGEYLMTRAFIDQWLAEDPSAKDQFCFEWRSDVLKGIGSFDYAIVKRKYSIVIATSVA
jgi:hypothetical protein